MEPGKTWANLLSCHGACLTASHEMLDMITVRLLDHVLFAARPRDRELGLALVAILIVARPFITAPARPGVS
jgi:hypothetical protein